MMSKDEWLERGLKLVCCPAYVCALLALLMVGGCVGSPHLLAPDSRQPIDRKVVEYPRGFVLKPVARGLTAPSAIAFVSDEGEYKGAMLVAESGADGRMPRIFGWKADRSYFNIYPRSRPIPTFGLLLRQSDIYGPIGGMVVHQGKIFVTHRDRNGRGVISKFGFDGSVESIRGGLPAQGDYGMTDIAVQPATGRLFFGIGAATNSGVVGLDNWEVGWVKKFPEFCDRPFVTLKLAGFKGFTKNPMSGLFGGEDNVGTAPFQAFGNNYLLRIDKSATPTSAIYSVSPTGGDLKVEAHGIRLPRGLGFHPETTSQFATNDGMELRGTRPVKNDPDAFVRILSGTWYGWPDFSTDLVPIHDSRFLATDLISRSGYSELTFVIDREASEKLTSPATFQEELLYGKFPSLSGAAKFDFTPAAGAFAEYRNNAIIALSGDRGPFATSGQPLRTTVGRKVVRLNLDDKRPEDFIYNTLNLPASKLTRGTEALERPVDVKYGPDGNLYILDYGVMEMRGGQEKISAGTGRIFVLEPDPEKK